MAGTPNPPEPNGGPDEPIVMSPEAAAVCFGPFLTLSKRPVVSAVRGQSVSIAKNPSKTVGKN